MDKNKAAYKLKNLPPIYYINLDEKPERAKFMEDQFKYWEIENYERISAYDGRGDRDLGDILKGRYPDMMSSGEVGCVTSHLKAMKHWLETSDAPCALLMEDDRLSDRIAQIFERIEVSLKQSLRIAQTQGRLPQSADSNDVSARAAMMMSYVVGRWHRYARSGFKKLPLEQGDLPMRVLFAV